MTAYEASDLLNGVISNQVAGHALFITIISAYLVVAYSVGDKLTTYQVSFINITFLLSELVGMTGSVELIGLAYKYTAIRAELLYGGSRIEGAEALAMWMLAGVRAVLILGSLAFMWQVRHQKTE